MARERPAGPVGYTGGRPFGDQVLSLTADLGAPALARQFVGTHAAALGPELLDDALVLVSELVTNAVRYGRPDITVRLRTGAPGLGVAVDDAGTDLPLFHDGRPDPTTPSGRGLLIVAALATRWGVTPADPPPGKAVWFELVP